MRNLILSLILSVLWFWNGFLTVISEDWLVFGFYMFIYSASILEVFLEFAMDLSDHKDFESLSIWTMKVLLIVSILALVFQFFRGMWR